MRVLRFGGRWVVMERLLHIDWPFRRCDMEQPGSAQDWAHYSPCCARCGLKPSVRYIGMGVYPVKDGVDVASHVARYLRPRRPEVCSKNSARQVLRTVLVWFDAATCETPG